VRCGECARARTHLRAGQNLAECEQRPRGQGQPDDGRYCWPHLSPPMPMPMPSQPRPGRDPLSQGHCFLAGQPGKDREQGSETRMVVRQRFLDPVKSALLAGRQAHCAVLSGATRCAADLAWRAEAARALRRSSQVVPPQMPSGMAWRAYDRQLVRTAQGAQTAFAAAVCRAAASFPVAMGKNSSGSARWQAPRDIQLTERAPDVTGSTVSRPPGRASASREESRAPVHGLGRG